MKKWILPLLAAGLVIGTTGSLRASPSITIDLSSQTAYLYHSGRLITSSPISSGKKGHSTRTGSFLVTEKNRYHRSGYYGSFVNKATGRIVRSGVDSRKSAPPHGTYFLGTSMDYFLRFNGPIGLHAGHLPGYPASRGCVRLPASKAAIFFRYAQLGTPVLVRH